MLLFIGKKKCLSTSNNIYIYIKSIIILNTEKSIKAIKLFIYMTMTIKYSKLKIIRPNYKLPPLCLVKVQFSPLSFDHFN